MEYPIVFIEGGGNPITCRVCLEHKATIPIFDVKDSPDPDVYTKLCQCLGETIEDEQCFPRHICGPCLTSLNTAVKFINQYKESDKTLRQYKKNVDLENEKKNSVHSVCDITIKIEHVEENSNDHNNYLKDNSAAVDKNKTVTKARTVKKRSLKKTRCKDSECSDDNIALSNIKKTKKSESDQNSDSSDEERSTTPDFVREAANEVTESLLPAISKERYVKTYHEFNKWRCENNIQPMSENVLIAYFSHLSKRLKPNSLWCIFSMLKTTLRTKNDVLINEFNNLTAFLRRLTSGYKPTKGKGFTAQEIGSFLRDAPDHMYLATKVALIIGISGTCKSKELVNVTTEDIEITEDFIVVTIKNNVNRSFVVREFVEFVKKYLDLRPLNCSSNRFFLAVRSGRCANVVIGKNKLAAMPKEVATYLNLPNAEHYTGHTFKRTPVSVLADALNLTSVNQKDGWKASDFVEVYIEDPIKIKCEITPLPGTSKFQ